MFSMLKIDFRGTDGIHVQGFMLYHGIEMKVIREGLDAFLQEEFEQRGQIVFPQSDNIVHYFNSVQEFNRFVKIKSISEAEYQFLVSEFGQSYGNLGFFSYSNIV